METEVDEVVEVISEVVEGIGEVVEDICEVVKDICEVVKVVLGNSEAVKHGRSSPRIDSNASLGHIPRARPTQLQHSSWSLGLVDIFDFKFFNCVIHPLSNFLFDKLIWTLRSAIYE